ncbi:MAG: lysostaphin resistance A-like protein, partial [Arachnia sp.]
KSSLLSVSYKDDVETAAPLPVKQSLVLLGVLLLATLVIFGLALGLAALLGSDAVIAVLTAAVGVHGVSMIAIIQVALRRAGSGWRALGFRPPTWRLLHLMWQLPLMLLVLVGVQATISALTGMDPAGSGAGVDSLLAGATPGAVAVLIVGIVVLVPIWEEATFRGVIYVGLVRRFSPAVAVFGSAAAFAVCHGVPILLPYMFRAGVSLALLRRFHRTLWGSVLAHMGLNGLVTAGTVLALIG